MKPTIAQTVKEFLQIHHQPGKPLLLGFSGGPDSLALLSLLMECRLFQPFDLHLAHIDHGWREESPREAKELQRMAEHLGVPFHLHRLITGTVEGNREAVAREGRLEFFSHLYRKEGFQALILAHHRDDQAETVLKRLFEGASLSHLGGMQPISFQGDMPIWRPLLNTPRKELEEWLESRGLRGLDDPTNRDPAFLRARMRTVLLPFVEKEFGKTIHHHLHRLGDQSRELREYLDRKTAPFFNVVQEGPFGKYIDFTPFCPLEKLEVAHCIRSLCERDDVLLSRACLEMLAEGILSGAADQQVVIGEKQLIVDRRHFFIVRTPLPNLDFQGVVESKTVQQEKWSWQILCQPDSHLSRPTSWKDLWLGTMSVCLPEGDYRWSPPRTNSSFPGASPIKDWWCKQRVPAFLRPWVPLILHQEQVVHEFLTGRIRPFDKASTYFISVNLKKGES